MQPADQGPHRPEPRLAQALGEAAVREDALAARALGALAVEHHGHVPGHLAYPVFQVAAADPDRAGQVPALVDVARIDAHDDVVADAYR